MEFETKITDIEDCARCGVLFNYKRAAKKIETETDYERTKIYKGRCPVCKLDFSIYDKR